jgi:SH3-like domain-containing protein
LNSGICHLPVIPLRAEPSDKSEMVSQLLYGESFEILQKEKQWRRIRSYFDDYEGWMDEKQMQLLDAEQLKKIQSAPQVCLTDRFVAATLSRGTIYDGR